MSYRCTIVPLALIGGMLASSAPVNAQSPGPAISVDIAAGHHAISPYIYGMAEYGVDPAYQAKAKLSLLRWGGDGTTRYNWQLDSSNAGFDWFFMGGGNANPTPSGGPDALVTADRATNTQTLLTIPIIPWINSQSAWNCSFPVSVYGPQQSINPYVHPNGDNCGNSLRADGSQLADTNIAANNLANSPALQQAWVQHLVATFGQGASSAHAGGVRFYQLDNEPAGWGNTHRDVMPGGAPYIQIASLGAQYAAAIKTGDPKALVLGPSDFTLGGWIGTPSQQNGLFAGQYYLQQFAANDKTSRKRTLDYFDEHYYFGFSDAATQLASTRTLWDPTYNGGTWVEQYFFGGPMQMIPRFKQWIAQYYPGTKLAISEYSIDSGQKSIADALAEADVLGIFGREGVDLAAMWSPPKPTDPIAFSFLLYRNYDGQGHGIGSTYVQTSSADQGVVSAYGSLSGRTLTLVIINKTAGALTVPVTLANPATTGTARMWSYTGADLTAIHQAADVAFSAGAANVIAPPMSMSVLSLPVPLQ